MPEALSVIFNGSDRVLADPGWATEGVLSRQIDDYELTDAWMEPETGTVMAMPLQMTPEYQSSAEGDLARLRLADFGSNSDWEEYRYRFEGDWFLSAKGVGKSARSARTWAHNQGFWLAFYVPGRPGWDGVVCEFQFGNARDTEAPYTARIRAQGQLELLEGDQICWSGWITRQPRSLVGQMVTLMVLPFRRNSILFWSNQGGSALYEDPAITDLSENAAYRITSGTQAVVRFPETRGVFQLMGLKFRPEFTLRLKTPVELPYAPSAEPDTSDLEWDVPSGTGLALSMLLPDGTAAVFDGKNRQFLWEIAGTGIADATPFVYRCPIRFPATTTPRLGTPVELTPDIVTARWVVGRNPDQRFFSFTLRNPERYPGLRYAQNRSLVVRLGENELFRGLAGEPRVSGALLDLEIRAQALWKRLDCTLLTDTRAYDGMRVVEAVRDVLERAGMQVRGSDGELAFQTEEVDLAADDTLILPRAPRNQAPWIRPAVGQSAGDFLQALKAAFCRDWSMEFRPVPTEDGDRVKFWFHPPEAEPVSQGIFYLSTESARLAGSQWIARELEFQQLEPEANVVQVHGVDSLGNPILVVQSDPSSMDPSLSEDERGANWLGERRLHRFESALVRTPEAAETLADALLLELSQSEHTARWSGPLIASLRPGMRVTLEGYGDFELLAMETLFEYSPNPYYPTRYLARKC